MKTAGKHVTPSRRICHMKTMLSVAVAGFSLAAAIMPAEAQFQSRAPSQQLVRKDAKGQDVAIPRPSNRAECLANRRALGFDIKKQGAGICDRLFPK
jgi:hypothetical protein